MQVTVHYIFSKNNKIGSKLISWGTKHLVPDKDKTPSHGAVLINERWVLESTLESGVRILQYSKWLKINEEVAKIPCKKFWDYSEIKKLYKELKGKGYDWLGVTYSAFCILLNKLYSRPIPTKNRWQNSNKYFCLEVIGKMTGHSYDMTTPVQLLKELNQLLKGN